jgi:hypothetical protein
LLHIVNSFTLNIEQRSSINPVWSSGYDIPFSIEFETTGETGVQFPVPEI